MSKGGATSDIAPSPGTWSGSTRQCPWSNGWWGSAGASASGGNTAGTAQPRVVSWISMGVWLEGHDEAAERDDLAAAELLVPAPGFMSGRTDEASGVVSNGSSGPESITGSEMLSGVTMAGGPVESAAAQRNDSVAAEPLVPAPGLSGRADEAIEVLSNGPRGPESARASGEILSLYCRDLASVEAGSVKSSSGRPCAAWLLPVGGLGVPEVLADRGGQ